MVKQATSQSPSTYGVRRPVHKTGLPGVLEKPKRKLRWPSRTVIRLILGAAVLAGIIVGVVTMTHRDASLDSVSYVEKRVARHYVLPADEEPALATIVDRTKITSPLFKKAENGDRVLIYQRNKLAIVYRPKIDKIVVVGPVTIDTPKGGVQ